MSARATATLSRLAWTRGAARGFTLIELVVTLALLSVLAMLAAPMAETAVQRGKEQALREALREIRDAIDRYHRAAEQGLVARKLGDSGYPPSLSVLVTGVPSTQDAEGAHIYFLRRLPRDPFFRDATVPAEATWGLRSYASAPDDPQPGDDVFDIYSLAPGEGLNGVALKEW